jgi:hypothetical protein
MPKKTSKKKLGNYLIFVCILKAIIKKSRFRIRNPVVWIRGSGSVSKPHGSGTLVKTLSVDPVKEERKLICSLLFSSKMMLELSETNPLSAAVQV